MSAQSQGEIGVIGGWGFSPLVLRPLLDAVGFDLPSRFRDINDISSQQFFLESSETDEDIDILIGWSLGAMAALAAVAAKRVKVRRLVLLAATASFVSRENLECGVAPAEVRALKGALSKDRKKVQHDFAMRTAGLNAAQLQPFYSDHQAGMLRGLDYLANLDLRREVEKVYTPTLLVHGARDQVISCAAGKSVYECLENATWLEYADGEHALMLSHKQQLAAAIRSFCY